MLERCIVTLQKIYLRDDNINQFKKEQLEYQNVVFVAHKYDGKKQNMDEVERIICDLQARFPDHLFVSPIHTFGMLYDKTDYDVGEKMCLWLLNHCDQMWVFGDNWGTSEGVKREIEFCAAKGIPVSFANPDNDIVIGNRQYFTDDCHNINNIWDSTEVIWERG